MDKKENRITVILGKRGTGKTHQAKALTEFRTRVVVYDTIREYDKQGYVVVETLEELEKQMSKDSFRVRFWDDLNDPELFNSFCELVYCYEDLILAIDEIDQHTNSNFCPVGLKKIINYGRHKSIELIATSRTPAQIPMLLRSQATDYFLFRMHEPAHLDYVGKIYDGDIEDIKKLPDKEHIHFVT